MGESKVVMISEGVSSIVPVDDVRSRARRHVYGDLFSGDVEQVLRGIDRLEAEIIHLIATVPAVREYYLSEYGETDEIAQCLMTLARLAGEVNHGID